MTNPRTSLFPRNNRRVVIEQGPVGDCYLLAALDCIFNSGTEGYNLIKSLFTEAPDGTVTVRIKRTAQSVNLNHEKLARIRSKYGYHLDRDSMEDVFTISPAQLDEIDRQPTQGVISNALAVKILESLSAYYYTSDWVSRPAMSSVLAHNYKLSRRFNGSSPTVFVGRLLGVDYHETKSFAEIIKLKILFPDQPVYIQMDYGQPDEAGHIHECHALRIDKVILIAGSQGDYEFVLVNPWNNQKTETFKLSTLRSRNCHFCLYVTNRPLDDLQRLLLEAPQKQGLYVTSNPQLLQIICSQIAAKKPIDAQRLSDCITLHQLLPYFATMVSLVNPDELDLLGRCLFDAKGNKDVFLVSLIMHIPRLSKVIMDNEAYIATLIRKKMVVKEPDKSIGFFETLMASSKNNPAQSHTNKTEKKHKNPLFMTNQLNGANHSLLKNSFLTQHSEESTNQSNEVMRKLIEIISGSVTSGEPVDYTFILDLLDKVLPNLIQTQTDSNNKQGITEKQRPFVDLCEDSIINGKNSDQMFNFFLNLSVRTKNTHKALHTPENWDQTNTIL